MNPRAKVSKRPKAKGPAFAAPLDLDEWRHRLAVSAVCHAWNAMPSQAKRALRRRREVWMLDLLGRLRLDLEYVNAIPGGPPC